MPLPRMTRRRLIGALIVIAIDPRRLLTACRDHHSPSSGPHPTPRKGIDASKIVVAGQLKHTPHARVAFDEVRQIPAIVDGIRCHCGCAGAEGFYSLLSCFEGEGMAQLCDICQGQGRLAFRLHRAGKSLAEIRVAIDDRYG